MGRVVESAGGGAVRGRVAAVIGLIGVVCCSSFPPYSCLLHPSSPPSRDQNVSFTVHFVASLAANSKKNERGIWPKCKKKHTKIQ